MNIGKKRNLGIDVLCCIGVMLLLNAQYLDEVGFAAGSAAWGDVLPALAWTLSMSGASVLASCIGYVLGTKELTSSHYLVFIRFLYIYIPCAAIALWMRVTMFNDILTDTDALMAVLTFSPTQTGGTVGMYFFLLLAAPLLNWFFRGLKYRPVRLVVIQLMAVLAGLQPILTIGGTPWLPRWVRLLYPAAAYLGGAYLCEYHKRCKRIPMAVILAVLACGTTTAVILTSGSNAVWVNDVASLPYLLIGLALLALCHSEENDLSPTHHFFMGAAAGSLIALLLGDLALDAALPAIDERFPKGAPRLAFGLVAVPVVFVLCAVIGLILQLPLFRLRMYLHPEMLEMEYENEKPRRRRHADVIMPERTHTAASKRRKSHDSRHSISVPVSDPEMKLHLTQPGMEKPQGVIETHLPDLPEVPPDYPEPDLPAEGDEGDVKVYVPKHAAAPGEHSSFSAASRAIEEAAEAAERHGPMTVDQILLETRKRRTRADTVNDLLRSLESEDGE